MIKEIKSVQVSLHAPEIYELVTFAHFMSALADAKEVSTHAKRNAKKYGIKMPPKQVGIQIPIEKAGKMFDILQKMGFITASQAGLEDEEGLDNPNSFDEELKDYQGFSVNENGEIVYNDITTAIINGAFVCDLDAELREGLNEEMFEKHSSMHRLEPETAQPVEDAE